MHDLFKPEIVPIEANIRWGGKLHKQVDNEPICLGDTVFDTGDNTIACVDAIENEFLVLKEGGIVEIAVPIIRVRKLVPIQ